MPQRASMATLDSPSPTGASLLPSPPWHATPLPLPFAASDLPLANTREELRASQWGVGAPEATAGETLIADLHAEARRATATGRGVGAALDDTLTLPSPEIPR